MAIAQIANKLCVLGLHDVECKMVTRTEYLDAVEQGDDKGSCDQALTRPGLHRQEYMLPHCQLHTYLVTCTF